MIDRIATFFETHGINYVADDRAVSIGFDDVAITVFASTQQVLVSARYRAPFSNLTRVNEWNIHHPMPTACVMDGELYFKQGMALGADHDITDEQLGAFLAATLSAIGTACEWFSQWK